MAKKVVAKPADWPPEKVLHLLNDQLTALQLFRKRRYRDVQHEEETWQQFTQSILLHGFGEDSQNVKRFSTARWAGEHSVMGTSEAQLNANFLLRIEKFQSVLASSIKELEASASLDSASSNRPEPVHSNSEQAILVLISHSSKDEILVKAVINLLRSGLGLLADQIRASSVDGYRLPGGANTHEQLRAEVTTVKALIGVLTPSSLASSYVLFELGARWGVGRFMLPLFAGISPEDVKGPHNSINGLSCESEGQLVQFVEDVGKQLGIHPQSAAAFLSEVKQVVDLASSRSEQPSVNLMNHKKRAASDVGAELELSVDVMGEPPNQKLAINASQRIKLISVDFMLSDGTVIATDPITQEEVGFAIGLKQELLTVVFNTPRGDMSSYDHSGPVRVGLTVLFAGRTRQYVLPARMENVQIGNTMYRKIIGKKIFYGEA